MGGVEMCECVCILVVYVDFAVVTYLYSVGVWTFGSCIYGCVHVYRCRYYVCEHMWFCVWMYVYMGVVGVDVVLCVGCCVWTVVFRSTCGLE